MLVGVIQSQSPLELVALFPFLQTRRPETYAALLESVRPA